MASLKCALLSRAWDVSISDFEAESPFTAFKYHLLTESEVITGKSRISVLNATQSVPSLALQQPHFRSAKVVRNADGELFRWVPWEKHVTSDGGYMSSCRESCLA